MSVPNDPLSTDGLIGDGPVDCPPSTVHGGQWVMDDWGHDWVDCPPGGQKWNETRFIPKKSTETLNSFISVQTKPITKI